MVHKLLKQTLTPPMGIDKQRVKQGEDGRSQSLTCKSSTATKNFYLSLSFFADKR
jgi:hypothetical protein